MKSIWVYLFFIITLIFLGNKELYSQEKTIGLAFTNLYGQSNHTDSWKNSKMDSIFINDEYNNFGLHLAFVYKVKSYDLRLLFSNINREDKNNTVNWSNYNSLSKRKTNESGYSVGLSFSKINTLNLYKRFKLHFGPNAQIRYHFNHVRTSIREDLNNNTNYTLTHNKFRINDYFRYQIGLQLSVSYTLNRFQLSIDTFTGFLIQAYNWQNESWRYQNNNFINYSKTTFDKNYYRFPTFSLQFTVSYKIH